MSYYSLDNITIASPCTANWDNMTGDNYVRFCAECKKNVFNLSELTREEAESILEDYEGKVCTRFYKRIDGTVLTADCPKGLQQLRSSIRRMRVKVLARALPILGLLGISIPSFGSYRDPIKKVPHVTVVENASFMGDTIIVSDSDLKRTTTKHHRHHKVKRAKQTTIKR